jgi:CheY-like chemotaxis protein
MLADDRVLVISRHDRWAEDLEKELRRVGYRQIDTVRQPLDALPILWETAPEVLILDAKNLGQDLLDVLRLCRDNNKPLAHRVALARCREGVGSKTLAEEQELLADFGFSGSLDSGASVVAMVRELERLRELPTADTQSQQFSLILFLNDRQRVEDVRQALEGHHFNLRVVNDFNALSGEFMSDPPTWC